MAHTGQVALALLPGIRHQEQAGSGREREFGGFPGAGKCQQGGESGSVVGNTRAAKTPFRIHGNIVFGTWCEYGVQVGGGGDIRPRSEGGRYVACAVDCSVPTQRSKSLLKPESALSLHKGGSR